jgi:hypothetical protein
MIARGSVIRDVAPANVPFTGAADAYQLAAALSRADEVRDRPIAATIATGNEEMPELRDLLLGRAGTVPDWDRAEKAARALTGALAHTPAGHRAGILTAVGSLAWL